MIKKDFKFIIYDSLVKRAESYPFYEKRLIIKLEEQEFYRDKTLDPSFKGAVFNYLNQILYLNQVNYKNFTYRICKENFINNRMVFYFQKDFYLLNQFNEKIEALHENGLINKWRSKFVDSRFANIKQISSGPMPLTVFHLLGSFEILAGMLMFCVAVFVFELLGQQNNFINKLFES